MQEQYGMKRLKRSGEAYETPFPASLLSRDVLVPVPAVGVGIVGRCCEQDYRVTVRSSKRIIVSLGVLLQCMGTDPFPHYCAKGFNGLFIYTISA